MPTLFILVGLPGCGKTTFAKNNLKDAYRVCHDDLVDMLTGEWHVNNTAHYHALEWTMVHTLLSRNQNVVVDRTNLTGKTRARFLNAADAAEVPVIKTAIVFDVPLEICLERNRSRTRIVPEAAYDKMLAGYQPVDPIEGFDEIVRVDHA